MEIISYPSKERVKEGFRIDEPMLAVISFDGKKAIVAQVEDSFEHHILLKQAGYSELDIDKFFRIRFDKSGAVCSCQYSEKSIIQEFLQLLGYFVQVN